MSWSTREIAELAGTTLRAVRHYHDIGLLPSPDRLHNGYKQYGVQHLLALIRIRRLVDLGLPLVEVAHLTELDEHPIDALRQLDGQLEQDMARIQASRDQLAVILQDPGHAADLGIELAALTDQALTRPDRLFMVLLVRLVSPHVLDVYLAMIEATRHSPLLAEFDALPADAADHTCADLADRMSTHLSDVYTAFPDLLDLTAGSPVGPHLAKRALQMASEELYNPAQRDVLRRTSPRAALRLQPPQAGR